jgi:uncharacterized protein (TIGR02118 family)
MRRVPSWWLVPSLALSAACGKPADKAPKTPADTAAAPAAAPAAGPKAIVTVIYNTPKDTAKFEPYYREKHLPLVSSVQDEIGFVKADLTRFRANLDGSKPAFYRQAELYFNSMDDLKKGTATDGFKKVADDLANFADNGLTGMIAVETNEPATVSGDQPMAIVTVLYRQPKANQAEIGFVKADLTRFVSNLDGSPPAFYRQAELYFKSMADLEKGVKTPGFKKVADDLPNFATGGLVGMTAIETK